MSKNIVICSDGTGNRGGKTRGTNVWRVFNAVDRHRRDPEQYTYYDDGVGTENLRWWRLFTGAFGWGLARNIKEAYAFLSTHYEPCDKVFLFGFSRGAFTVRSLAGLVCKYGIAKRSAICDDGAKQHAVIDHLLRAYRIADDRNKEEKHFREIERLGVSRCNDFYVHNDSCDSRLIHFIGVWDTVDAVGLPFDELKRAISWMRAKVTHNLWWNFRDYEVPTCVHCAYQALALDDERKTFHPILWRTPTGSIVNKDGGGDNPCVERDIEQVWFAGTHANVGGGYPNDSLSFVSLDWMMSKSERCGLKFTKCARAEVQRIADAHGRLYDSRAGWGAFYRPALRGPGCCPRVHASVDERIKRGTQYYAPKVIMPGQYTTAG